MSTEIIITERSATRISADTFRRLDASPAFWELLEAGVLTAERRGRCEVSIRAGPFVGCARVGDTRIRVKEKVPGSLAALVECVTGASALSTTAPTSVSEDAALLGAIAHSFVSEVEAYLRSGRRKAYYPRTSIGASPRGKIQVDKTMRVWASGRRDRCAFVLQDLAPERFLNGLVGAAVAIVECMTREWPGCEILRRRFRTAALLFEDSDWHGVLKLPIDLFDIEYIRASSAFGSLAGLAGISRLFVRHFGIIDRVSNDEVPRSWFVKLESLFEEAVRQAISRAAASHGLRATDWRAAQRYVISGGSRWRAQPDVVLWRGATHFALVDAKYKDIPGDPDHGDVYQVLCHAGAWDSAWVALAHPANATEVRVVGKSSEGTQLIAAALDILNLDSACEHLVDCCVNAPWRID